MSTATPSPARPSYAVVGRYAIYDEIASGGMATVHLGKLLGAGGFSRVVAVKRLHPQFAKDAEFSSMFMDEARLAARIHHPNVVQTLDVVAADRDLLLVMEYVHGVSFASLLHLARKAKVPVDPRVVAAVVAAGLEGLHAAHEAKSEGGVPLGVVHRDVSPQNILVGVDGTSRILDFGVAKAMGNSHATRDGQLKGKLAYMSPEQVRSQDVTRRSDVFSAAIVLWEALMGRRLFDGVSPAELIMQVLSEPIASPRSRFPDLPPALEAVVMKGLCRDPAGRYATAREMAVDLEAAVSLAPAREVARWVEGLAGETLNARSQLLERIERAAAGATEPPPGSGPILPFAATLAAAMDPAIVPQSGTRPSPRAVIEGLGGGRSSPSPAARHDGGPSEGPPNSSGHDEGASDRRRAPPPAFSLDDHRRPVGGPPPVPRPERDPFQIPESPAGGSSPHAGHVGAADLTGPSRPPPRVHQIPVETGEEAQVSLRERIEGPLKVVAAGVVLSVADTIVRAWLPPLPFRVLWIAEALVVTGVLWLTARLALPMRSR